MGGTITILSWRGKVLYKGEHETLREAIEHAVRAGISLRGADLYEASLQYAYLQHADLPGADLRYAALQGADLRDADLRGANLHAANLSSANLEGANLTGADLYLAELGGSNLTGANLFFANMRGADLNGANLTGAKLEDADMEGANLEGTVLAALEALGPVSTGTVKAVYHGGPSDGREEVMLRPAPRLIPLRGPVPIHCGAPDNDDEPASIERGFYRIRGDGTHDCVAYDWVPTRGEP